MSKKTPTRPLEKIALSCSGGGYRAASFHLGAMAYLNQVSYYKKPLLENVLMISTVSGGTITGIVYAQQKQQGKSFKDIYDFLMGTLHNIDLVKEGIQKLSGKSPMMNTNKRPNLINAFAELYDQHLCSGETMDQFSEMKSHLEAVVFNSTEFSNAINFRFRNKGFGQFGNNKIRVSWEEGAEVKLADAMACSSCFPGGFEPMIWPNDFIHANSPALTKLKGTTQTVGIMDGGIYDNQGIQSILLYKKKPIAEDPYFDLVIISDVASPDMTPFQPLPKQKDSSWRELSLRKIVATISTISKKVRIATIVSTVLLLLAPLLWGYSLPFYNGLFVGIALVPLTILILFNVIRSKVIVIAEYVQEFIVSKIPLFYREKLKDLNVEDLPAKRVEELLLNRLSSLITLLSSVFLKVVRRLNYDKLYEDERYTYRRISNLVKELNEDQFQSSDKLDKSIFKGDYDKVVGEKIKEDSEEAASFGTTLWFQDDDKLHQMLDKLVATGEFTMCYNLIDYLEKLMFTAESGYENLDEVVKTELRSLYDSCCNDWEKFKANPRWLIEEYNKPEQSVATQSPLINPI